MTHPSWKKPLILAASLVILGTFAYWLEYKSKPEKEAKQALLKQVFDLSGVQLKKIEIAKDSRKLVFSCRDSALCKPGDNSSWEILEPIRFKADDSNTNALVSALNNLNSSEVIDLSQDAPEKRADLLKQYQLDEASRSKPATRTVTITDASGGTRTAYFGDKHPISDGYFVGVAQSGRFDDSRVFVLPAFHAANLEQPILHWRDKKVLTLTQNEVMRMETKSTKIERVGSLWNLVNGKESRAADTDAVDAWISAAVFLQAKGFAAEKKDSPEAKRALIGAKPVLALKVASVEKEQILTLYSKDFVDGKNRATQAFATVSDLDPLYEVATTALDQLDKPASALRPGKLIPTQERLEVTEIEIEMTGARPFFQKLKRDGKEWKLGKQTANAVRVNALLDRLSTRVIEDFTARPVATEGLRLAFAIKPGEIVREFRIWFAEGKVFASDMKSGSKETFILSKSLQELLPDTESFITSPTKTQPTPHAEEDHDGHAH